MCIFRIPVDVQEMQAGRAVGFGLRSLRVRRVPLVNPNLSAEQV